MPGTGDSAVNKIDRVPALMEFTFWCVGGSEVRNDETQINSCALCQVVQRGKEKKDKVPGPRSLRCTPLRVPHGPQSSQDCLPPSRKLAPLLPLPSAGMWPSPLYSTPSTSPKTPSVHASLRVKTCSLKPAPWASPLLVTGS